MTTQGDGTVKRRRGRPRKNPVSEQVIFDQEGTGEGMAQASVATPAEEALPKGLPRGVNSWGSFCFGRRTRTRNCS